MVTSTVLTTHYLVSQKKRLTQNVINYRREKEFLKSVLTMVNRYNLELMHYYYIIYILGYMVFDMLLAIDNNRSFTINY